MTDEIKREEKDGIPSFTLGVPDGEPYVCDLCNMPITTDERIAIVNIYGTDFGATDEACYIKAGFKAAVERGKMKLILKFKKGEHVEFGDNLNSATAMIICRGCGNMILYDMGMVTPSVANEKIKNFKCPRCGTAA